MLVVTFNLNKQIKGDYLIIMRNFKLATMIFAIMATICFTACDNDNDKKHDANTCEPAACEMAEHAAEMGCDDAGHCVVKACAETFKLGDDGKCTADEPACMCDPACNESEDCIKGDDSACGCRAKDKPATCDPACEDGKTKCECTMEACACVPVTAPTCDPACNAETEDCICTEDKCECRVKDNPVEECFCDDAKTVKCPEGGKDACAADPSVPADACQDKSEGDACDENKTCQKGEGDKLECKDKPADPAPAE